MQLSEKKATLDFGILWEMNGDNRSNNLFSEQAEKCRNIFFVIFRFSLRFRKIFCYSLHSRSAIKINNTDLRILEDKKQHREIGEERMKSLKSVLTSVKLRNFSRID